jgi:hypothetical protein
VATSLKEKSNTSCSRKAARSSGDSRSSVKSSAPAEGDGIRCHSHAGAHVDIYNGRPTKGAGFGDADTPTAAEQLSIDRSVLLKRMRGHLEGLSSVIWRTQIPRAVSSLAPSGVMN